LRQQTKIHFIVAGYNGVLHGHAIGQRIAQPQLFPVRASLQDFAAVLNHRMFGPVGLRRTSAAVSFKVVDANFAG
jgi:hypothetical protein